MRRPARTTAFLVLCCSLWSPLLLGSVAAIAQTAVTPQDYVARLRASLTALQGLDDPVSSEDVGSALAVIGLPLNVRLPGGAEVLVTRESLLGDQAAEGGADAAAARIQAALDAAVDAAGTTPVDPATIDGALATAYDGRELRQPSLAARLWADVGQALRWLVDHAISAVSSSSLGGVIGIALLIGLLAGGVAILLRAGRATVTDARWSAAGTEPIRTDWRRIADDALSRGDLREAVRALYHVLLAALAVRGLIRDDASLTAGECRRAVRRTRPALAPEVDRATTAFERVMYGRLPARDEDVDALREAERAVRRP